MAGKCLYTLSRTQIFLCLIRPWMFRLYIASTALFFACVGVLVWLLFTSRLGYEDLLTWIFFLGFMYVLFDVAVLGYVYHKAGRAPDLPAGKTVAEWDDLGISFRAGQEFRHTPWNGMEYRLLGKDLIISFPDGHFTLVSSPPLDAESFVSIRGHLKKA